MSDKNYTHMAIVMDRSGSMSGIAKDMEGGLKSLIAEQKKLEGKVTLTFARFDSEYDIVYDFADIQNTSDFALQPRGSTALLDAMGKTMENVKLKIEAMDNEQKPSKVMFIFITDGQENASREYRRDRIFQMIGDLSNADSEGNNQIDDNGVIWDFRFLGANQDAISEGSSYGIRAGASMTYDASHEGSVNVFRTLTKNVSEYRTSGYVKDSFSDEDRKQNSKNDVDTNYKTSLANP